MTPKSARRSSDDIMLQLLMLQLMRIDHQAVIPGRAAGANPESTRKDKNRGWNPGSACGRPETTLQVGRVSKRSRS
jgi:hypothetical protein